MKWKRIPKEKSQQPPKGKYSDWKPQLASEGFNQCVYCAIHEANFGGIRNFHVEHYRPKSKFKKLENDIKNLFYSCAICNTFKGDDWPDEPRKDFSNASYPYPGEIDYSDIFKNDPTSCVIEGEYIASKYITEKLFLNRPQLIMERRIHHALFKLDDLNSYFMNAITGLGKSTDKKAMEYLVKFAEISVDISSLQTKYHKLTPYKSSDVKK